MKKTLVLALFAIFAASANAAPKKVAKKVDNSPVFTVIKENPITSIKNQIVQVRVGIIQHWPTLNQKS